METDTDFLERRNETVRARRRVKLCFLALLSCVIMMADLISDAHATVGAERRYSELTFDAVVEHHHRSIKTNATHCRLL